MEGRNGMEENERKQLQTFSTNQTTLYLSRLEAGAASWDGQRPMQVPIGGRTCATPGLLGPVPASLPTHAPQVLDVSHTPAHRDALV